MTPELRKLEDLQAGGGFNATAIRASAFLSVDVSILPLTARQYDQNLDKVGAVLSGFQPRTLAPPSYQLGDGETLR